MFDDCVNETKLHAQMSYIWPSWGIVSTIIVIFLPINTTFATTSSFPQMTLLIRLKGLRRIHYIGLPFLSSSLHAVDMARSEYIDDYARRYRI